MAATDGGESRGSAVTLYFASLLQPLDCLFVIPIHLIPYSIKKTTLSWHLISARRTRRATRDTRRMRKPASHAMDAELSVVPLVTAAVRLPVICAKGPESVPAGRLRYDASPCHAMSRVYVCMCDVVQHIVCSAPQVASAKIYPQWLPTKEKGQSLPAACFSANEFVCLFVCAWRY
jgi:hypothetical protein